MKDSYTTALLELFATDVDVTKVLKGFKDTLEKRGYSALYGPVLGRVFRKLSARRPSTVVTVANDTANQEQKAAIEAALKALGADAEAVVVTDQTIVGGYIAEHGGKRQDHSYKSKLVSLYRSITN